MIPGFPGFPPDLSKRATWSGFEVEPFEVELAIFQEFFPVVKKKKSLPDLSHDLV